MFIMLIQFLSSSSSSPAPGPSTCWRWWTVPASRPTSSRWRQLKVWSSFSQQWSIETLINTNSNANETRTTNSTPPARRAG